VGICRVSDYEGEAATLLQFAAEEANSAKAQTLTREISEGLDLTRIETRDGAPFLVLATDELFCRLTEARLRDVDATEIAWAFHKVLANMVVEAAARVAAQEGLDTVALSGGCFQNTLLLSLVEQGLKEQGLKVLTHSLTPPNDGGIALGQAVNAARRLEKTTTQPSD
jgi:hydrogenase maturation protein HypF